MTELYKLLFLFGLIGFFVGLGVMVMRVDRSEAWKKAHVAQLVVNRYGELDIAAVSYWIGLGSSVMFMVYATFKFQPKEAIAVFGIFVSQITVPLMLKLIFKGKAPEKPPAVPEAS